MDSLCRSLILVCSLLWSIATLADYPPGDLRAHGISSANTAAANTAALNTLTATFTTGTVFDVVEGDIPLNTVTIPARHSLRFGHAGRLNAQSGQTVTINGGIIAGDRQHIFTVSGTGKFASATHRDSYPHWFGAVGDGSTPDHGAVQAAANFAGTTGVLHVNAPFLCEEGIVLPRYITVQGLGVRRNTPTGAVPAAPGLYSNQTDGTFINFSDDDLVNVRNYVQFNDVLIANTTGSWSSSTHQHTGNTAIGLAVIDNFRMRGSKIEGWQTHITLSNAPYYSEIHDTEFLIGRIGIRPLTDAYTMQMHGGRMSQVEYPFNQVFATAAFTNLTLHGTRIENYRTVFDGIRELACFGCYFETEIPSAFGMFSSQAEHNVAVTLIGSTIYLNNHNRFVNLSGRTSVALAAHGNSWRADEASASGAIAYYLPSSGAIDISADEVTSTFNATYTIGDSPSYNIQFPLGVGRDGVTYHASLHNTATYDPPSLADGTGVTTTVTITGATVGDLAEVGFGVDLQGIMVTSWVSAPNTVSIRFQNETGAAINLASASLQARVRKR